MNPAKVNRQRLSRLTDLPNIGPAGAADLRLLGINEPEQLCGRDPYEMYTQLCALTGMRQDPCVLDVFISITRFMAGDAAQAWWAYSGERQRQLATPGKISLSQPLRRLVQ